MLTEAINKNYDKLNNSDLQSLEIIMEHTQSIGNMTIEELANKCSTSKSTISRLAQKLGFSGYSEFKNCLKWENKNQVPSEDYSYRQALKQDFVLTVQQMEDSSSLMKVANEIYRCQNVVVYGTGQAQRHCAKELQRLLMQVNKYVSCVEASDEFRMLAKNLSSNDCVIILSLSGNADKFKDTLQLLRLKNVKMVSITNLQSNFLASMCNYNLYAVSSPLKLAENLYHNSFITFLTVIEYIFLAYMEVIREA